MTVGQHDGEDLPRPDSDEIQALFGTEEVRLAYRFLWNRRDDPPTMVEWRQYAAEQLGEAHSQADRRLRDVRNHFVVELVGSGRSPGYRLVGRKFGAATKGTARVSSRVEAQVYEAYGYRCAMCGRTPKDDGIRLHIDHKIPRAWGGSNGPENLQPLCAEHNHGKQAHFATFDKYADEIRQSIEYDEVHIRIGELLKVFHGKPVPVDLIDLVALEENRGDPTRRLRELRALGWQIESSKSRQGNRMMSYYRLVRAKPWPPEGPRQAVNRIERERKRRKREGRSGRGEE